MQELFNITVYSPCDEAGDWEYRAANTKEFTHCFHQYPASMIPQIVRRLLRNYQISKEGLLFDPYCGTGTSLAEGMHFGMSCVGTDLNPLAKLIAKVKTTPLEMDRLKSTIDTFAFELDGFNSNLRFELNNSKYILNWFKEETINKLNHVKSLIELIDNKDIKDFFLVAFSETVRECSLTRNGEFKLLKIPKDKLELFDPDVYSIMKSKLVRNSKGMIDFMNVYNSHKIKPMADIYDFNTVENIPENIIKPETVDIVITSPPYGDSQTTVAYGQFSRLSNEWLGFENSEKVDSNLMGGKIMKGVIKFNFKKLDNAIETIRVKDKRRAMQVCSFYNDLEKSIKNIALLVKSNGYVCYVIGNRIVKGIKLPTHEVVIDFYRKSGFTHIDTFIREIPNKRMPLKNSPSNIKGLTESTMLHEYIIVMRKN